MFEFPEKQLFVTITEASKILNIEASKLRYWEKEFPTLNPKKGGNGKRFYKKEDLKEIYKIKILIIDKGLKIVAAKKKLKEKRDQKKVDIIFTLENIKQELIKLK